MGDFGIFESHITYGVVTERIFGSGHSFHGQHKCKEKKRKDILACSILLHCMTCILLITCILLLSYNMIFDFAYCSIILYYTLFVCYRIIFY